MIHQMTMSNLDDLGNYKAFLAKHYQLLTVTYLQNTNKAFECMYNFEKVMPFSNTN